MHLSDENSYSDHHRIFIQKLMMKNVLTKDQAIQLYMNTKPNNTEDIQIQRDENGYKVIQRFIDEINAKIEAVNLRIKLSLCETTNEKVYVLHTINENDITKVVAERCSTKKEREYLLAVIKAIVTNSNGSASDITCLNLSSSLSEHTTKKEVNKILAKLVNQCWLQMDQGRVCLGPRLMVEMKKYLQEEYGEHLSPCQLCKELTLRGEKCPAGCGIKLHTACLEAYFAKAAARKCVSCKKPWPIAAQTTHQSESDTSDNGEDY